MKKFTLFVGMLGALTLSSYAQAPANDTCANAVDISSALGQAIGTVVNMGPYDNTNATHSTTDDPTTGWDCFGEPDGSGNAPSLEKTVWFTFPGDGETYFIESGNGAGVTNYINDGDTQFALYTGSCGSLSPIKCNEDGPSATSTTYPAGLTISTVVGTTYYLMVDGFSFNGVVAKGQFLLKVKRLQSIPCDSSVVSAGTFTADTTALCQNDSVIFTHTGAYAPLTGTYAGMSYILSSAPLLTPADLLVAGNIVATYGIITSPVPTTAVTRKFKNDGTLIDGAQISYGMYYWTPIIFGNAEKNPNSTNATPIFLSDLTLDTACVHLGTSIGVMVYDPADNFCKTNTAVTPKTMGINSIFPIPATNELNFVFATKNQAKLQVRITDVTGREVFGQNLNATVGTNEFNLNIKDLKEGVYFLNVNDGENVSSQKFVKE